jgi:Na+-transporting NADH:ubiquinone oxidoreductase subunit C
MAEMSNSYILGFATAICVVSSLALAGTHAALKPIQDVNVTRDFQKDVLSALGLPEDGHAPVGEEIDALFASRVGAVVVDAATGQPAPGKTAADVQAAWDAVKGTGEAPALLGVYTRKAAQGDAVEKYAMEVRGRGLWGPISGYLAIEPDGRTVGGTVFFAPAETPGLGAEITAEPFKAQWRGKQITDATGRPKPIVVAKGKAAELCPGEEAAHCVDGVSGATLTGRGVTEMVDAGVAMYAPFFASVRAAVGQGGSR